MRSTFYVLPLALPVRVIPLALAPRNSTKVNCNEARQRKERIDGKGHAFLASIVVVTNTNDSGPGSLRDALANANHGYTIDATSVSGPVLLTSGELQITHDVTIKGPGSASLTVDGTATFRVFENFGSNVTISAFTITNASSDTNGRGGILITEGSQSQGASSAFILER